MCRWVLYRGPEIPLAWLITRPAHSIIRQSFHAELREEPLNGDGFGLAWYVPARGPEPAVFRSIQPAWNNTNLLDLARVSSSETILGHVRAATPGLGVSEANCHPFRWGRQAFMHNGSVAGFSHLRRKLLSELSDESFQGIEGSTDTEHVFGLYIDAFRRSTTSDPLERMAEALCVAIERTCELADEVGADEPTLLNLAVSDGERSVVSRVVHNGPQAHSLFFTTGKRYLVEDDGRAHRLDQVGPGATVVASEPLSDDEGWAEVASGSLLLMAGPDQVEERRL